MIYNFILPYCQAQSQLHVKLSLKTELALILFPPPTPGKVVDWLEFQFAAMFKNTGY